MEKVVSRCITVTTVIDGADGEAGVSVATVTIYKRALTVLSVDKPTNNARYYFKTVGQTEAGSLVPASGGSLNGWSTEIPSNAGALPCWTRQAVVSAVATADYGIIASSDWSSAVKMVEDGSSPYVADIDNGMDGVPCTSSGNAVAAFDKTMHVSLRHGNDAVSLTSLSYAVNGGSSYTTEQTVDNIKVTPNASAKTVRVRVAADALVAATNDITITLTGDGVSRSIHFVLNGVRAGADGTPAVVYNLLPSQTVIKTAKTANGYSPSTESLTCGYTKTDGSTVTTVANATTQIDSKYNIYFRRRIRSTSAFEEDFIAYNGSASSSTRYSNARSLLASLGLASYDAVEFYLSDTNTTTYKTISGKSVYYLSSLTSFVDKETVPVVADGAEGSSIKIRGTAIAVVTTSRPTDAEENDIILENGSYDGDDTQYWNGSTWEEGIPNSSSAVVGDGFIVDGHLWQLTYGDHRAGRWTDCGQIKGADAVMYEIRLSESSITVNPSGAFEGMLKWSVIMHEGANSTFITPDQGVHRFRAVGSDWQDDWESPDDDSQHTFDIGSYLDDADWRTFPDASHGKVRGTGIEISFSRWGSEQATIFVPFTIKGQMSRNLYYAGDWSSFAGSFEVTDYKAPYFSYTNNGTTTYWAFVGENGTYTQQQAGTPSASNAKWRQMTNEFSYLIANGIFTEFAKMGSAVFNGDYMFSQHGYLRGYSNTRTDISDGSQFQNVDPNDMFGQVFDESGGTVYEGDGLDAFPFSQDGSGTTIYSTGRDYVDIEDIAGSGIYYTDVANGWYSFKFSANGKFEWKVGWTDGTSNVTLDSGTVNSNSDVTVAVNVNVNESGTGHLALFVKCTDNTTSAVNYAYARHCKFVPYTCFNWLTGEAVMNKLFLRAGLIRMMTEVTPSNYELYTETMKVRVTSATSATGWTLLTLNTLNIVTLGSNLHLTGSWTSIPNVYCPDFSSLTDDEKNIVRGMAGQDITVVNNSGRIMKCYGNVEPYGGGSWYNPSGSDNIPLPFGDPCVLAIHVNSVAIFTIDYYLEETVSGAYTTYGEEKVRLRVRATRMRENSN